MRNLCVTLLVTLATITALAQTPVPVTFLWDMPAGETAGVTAQYERDGVVADCGAVTTSGTGRSCVASLLPGTSVFRIRMLNSAGGQGGWSDTITTTIPGTTPGTAPGAFTIRFSIVPPMLPPVPPTNEDITLRQQTTNIAVLGNGTHVFATPTTAGSLLVAYFSNTGPGPVTAVTTSGLTWQKVPLTATYLTESVEIWYALDPTGGVARTVAWTVPSGLTVQIGLAEYGGFTAGVNLGPSNSASNVNVTTTTSGVITTTASKSLLACAWRSSSGSYALASRGNGFLALQNGNRAVTGYKITSAIETTECIFRFGVAESGPQAIVTFQQP